MIDNATEILKRILKYSKRKDDCLVCYLGLNSKGRPRILINKREYAVSRMIMHLIKDFDLASPLWILHNDEVCKSPACIEIDHMRIGTPSENTLDKFTKHGFMSRQTKAICKRGHRRTPDNIDANNACKQCKKERRHLYG